MNRRTSRYTRFSIKFLGLVCSFSLLTVLTYHSVITSKERNRIRERVGQKITIVKINGKYYQLNNFGLQIRYNPEPKSMYTTAIPRIFVLDKKIKLVSLLKIIAISIAILSLAKSTQLEDRNMVLYYYFGFF